MDIGTIEIRSRGGGWWVGLGVSIELKHFNFDNGNNAYLVEHYSKVFKATDVEETLAAGIFHRREVPIEDLK